MYGLINRAVQDLLTGEFGEAVWGKIAAEAGCAGIEFAPREKYPDELTERLVAATSQVLGIPADYLLRAVGKSWTELSVDASYDEMLASTGGTFARFLAYLEELPMRVARIFPELEPPVFEAEELGDGTTLVHYYSARRGLAPMMHGLLEGLAERFGVSANIMQVRSVDQGSGHDVFRIRTAAVA